MFADFHGCDSHCEVVLERACGAGFSFVYACGHCSVLSVLLKRPYRVEKLWCTNMSASPFSLVSALG